MNRASRRGSRGFTIAEILISIAVITIALLGTIAAIAYGLRASRVGGDDSVAVSINRKVIELILQNQFSATLPAFNHAPADPDAPRATGGWQPLYLDTGGTWFRLSDYGFTSGTPEATRFIRDTQDFELDVSSQPPPAPSPANDLAVDQKFFLITVTTRWQDKHRWRWLRTETYSTTF